MPGYRNIAGTWKAVVPWRNIAGTWKAGTLWRNIAGTWKAVAGALTASANTPVNGSGSGVGTQVVTSATTTAAPSGGIGPYTYSWTRVSGDVLTITSPTSASTTFSKSMAAGTTATSIHKCTVTDTTTGFTADTNNVNTFLENEL